MCKNSFLDEGHDKIKNEKKTVRKNSLFRCDKKYVTFAGDARPHCAYYGGEFKAFSGG